MVENMINLLKKDQVVYAYSINQIIYTGSARLIYDTKNHGIVKFCGWYPIVSFIVLFLFDNDKN